MMELTEELLRTLCTELHGAPRATVADPAGGAAPVELDFGPPFARVDFVKSLEDATGTPFPPEHELGRRAPFPPGAPRRGAAPRPAHCALHDPPPPPPLLVLSGHAASLTPYQPGTRRPSPRTNRTRCAGLRARDAPPPARAPAQREPPRGSAEAAKFLRALADSLPVRPRRLRGAAAARCVQLVRGEGRDVSS